MPLFYYTKVHTNTKTCKQFTQTGTPLKIFLIPLEICIYVKWVKIIFGLKILHAEGLFDDNVTFPVSELSHGSCPRYPYATKLITPESSWELLQHQRSILNCTQKEHPEVKYLNVMYCTFVRRYNLLCTLDLSKHVCLKVLQGTAKYSVESNLSSSQSTHTTLWVPVQCEVMRKIVKKKIMISSKHPLI